MTRWTLAALAAALGSPAAAQGLLDELAETGRFDRFVAGIEAADLRDRLDGAVTVLAPTDEAYHRAVGPELERAFANDPALAREVLLTHVQEGAAHPSDDLPRTMEMASGENVSVEWTGGRLLATVDGGAETSDVVEIERGDIRSGEGIAHPITGLLLPQDSTLAAIADPAAPGGAEEETPIPPDGSYLDEVVGGADPDAIELAPVEEAAGEDGGGSATAAAPEEEAGEDVSVVTLVPQEEAADAPEDEPAEAPPPADDSPEAAGVGEAVRAATDLAEGAGGGGDVVIEEMNVTVEAAPQVEPRTVAPSQMMDDPSEQAAPDDGQADGGQAQERAAAQPGGQGAASPGGGAAEGGSDGRRRPRRGVRGSGRGGAGPVHDDDRLGRLRPGRRGGGRGRRRDPVAGHGRDRRGAGPGRRLPGNRPRRPPGAARAGRDADRRR